MKRTLIFLACLLALFLPWRLRVLYAQFVGWILQGIYWLRFALVQAIVKGLRTEKANE